MRRLWKKNLQAEGWQAQKAGGSVLNGVFRLAATRVAQEENGEMTRNDDVRDDLEDHDGLKVKDSLPSMSNTTRIHPTERLRHESCSDVTGFYIRTSVERGKRKDRGVRRAQ